MNSIRLAMVTWNVGGGPSGITPGTDKLLRCARNADVIVVGLQEVGVGRRGWKTHLAMALGKDWMYIGGESYAGLRLRVFAHVRSGKPVASIAAAGMKVGAGFADRWPNKGAIAVEIRFAQTCRVLFVVAHLAANENQVNERQDDWRAILRRLDKEAFLTRATDPAITVPLFHRYEHVFVLGDLNYRIEAPGTDRDKRVRWVQHHVDNRDWETLLSADQLTRERLSGKVFANFQEASINFAPTFKIDPRTGQYSSARVPSYCDRVLWHSLPARVSLIRNSRYEPLSEFRQSDHVPIVAEFQLDVPIITPPYRTLNATRGLRVVLEFMLVRFIKGRPASIIARNSFEDDPKSMRRIQQPHAFRFSEVESPMSNTRMHKRAVRRRADRLRMVSDIHDENDPMLDPDGIDDDDLDQNLDDFDDFDREDAEEDFSSTSSDTSSSDLALDDGDDLLYHDYAAHCEGFAMEPSKCITASTDIEIPPDSKQDTSPSLSGSREYDENLLSDLMSRHVSTSSSTDTCTPNSTPVISPNLSRGGSDERAEDSSSVIRGPHLSECNAEIGSAHSQSAPRKRDSLSRQVHDRRVQSKTRRRSRLNGLRMEVHGPGLFLKQGRVYSITIPKRRNGHRERIGESLPVIPFKPLSKMEDLEFSHVLIEFARKKSRVGTSGALPLKELLACSGERYAFEMALTKYGQPVGTLEACVQLTIRDTGCWMDANNRVVRNHDGGSNKSYVGSLPIRKKTSAKTKPDNGRWR